MGYYMDNDTQQQRFLSDYKLKLIFSTLELLFRGNRTVWKKVFSRLKHKPQEEDWEILNYNYETIEKEKRGDLLSVCVLPEYRGTGLAQDLISAFLDAMRSQGKALCLLSVESGNARARTFYLRNGFELYRRRGSDGLTYIKPLYSDVNNNVSD